MIIYKEELISKKRKSELERGLKERLVSEEDRNKLYFFPFSLFSSPFWKDFKRTKRVLFSGEYNGQFFKLETDRLVFTNRTNLPLTITGSIEENKIYITYSIPVFAILSIVGFLLTVYLFTWRIEPESEILTFVMATFLFLMYITKILRIHYAFKRICN